MKMKKMVPLLLMFLLTTFIINAQGNGNLDGNSVKTAFDKEWGYWKDILKTVTTIIVALGGIALAYAYLTNRQESKDHLTKWAIGLVVIAIIRTIL
jgi:hypothetical protein